MGPMQFVLWLKDYLSTAESLTVEQLSEIREKLNEATSSVGGAENID